MNRTVVVCADDYAFSPSICDAILDLASRGRISAISCMTASPLWPEQGPRLLPLRGKVDIGLHLSLIEDSPLTSMRRAAPRGTMPTLSNVIRASYTGGLPLDEYALEIQAQVDAFTTVMGVPPSHLDGHRHTHVLPGLRTLVLQAAAWMNPRPWIRNIAEPLARIVERGVAVPKAAFLTTLGRALPRAARDAGVPVNDGFSGVYDLRPRDDLPDLFAKFLSRLGPRPLVMCHPGAADTTPLGPTRAREYAFLASDGYRDLLAREGLAVARFAASG